MGLAISNACRNKIIEFEVGGREYYEKFASRPTWPGGASGVTIGIGYDLGQHTAEQFQVDWARTRIDRTRLVPVCDLSGSSAKWVLHSVADMLIPWPDAIMVFDQVTLSRYAAMTEKAFPNCNKLPQDAFGALVDLVYNRGADVTSMTDQRAEMRAIKTAMLARNISAIPAYLRSMKRLWPVSKGLLARREWEAATFEAAITGKELP